MQICADISEYLTSQVTLTSATKCCFETAGESAAPGCLLRLMAWSFSQPVSVLWRHAGSCWWPVSWCGGDTQAVGRPGCGRSVGAPRGAAEAGCSWPGGSVWGLQAGRGASVGAAPGSASWLEVHGFAAPVAALMSGPGTTHSAGSNAGIPGGLSGNSLGPHVR